MSKTLYTIFAFLGLALIADILSENIPKVIFTIILIIGVKLQLREAYLILKVYGHILLAFLTYGVGLHIQGLSGFRFLFSMGSYSLPESLAIVISISALIVYFCLIYSQASKVYFQKQILPLKVTKHINGNILACYFSFAIIGSALFESNEIKLNNINTSSFLSSSEMYLQITKAHYTKSSSEYDEMALILVDSIQKGVSELTYIPEHSKEALETIERVSNEIKPHINK